MGNVIRKEQCPRCAANGGDTSCDNLIIYEDESYYCFVCGNCLPSEEYRQDNFDYEEFEREMMAKEPITQEELEELKVCTGTDGQDSRGISNATYKKYAVRFGYDDEQKVDTHYYPYFDKSERDYKLLGFKVRYLPKSFDTVGKTGISCSLFGQQAFKNSMGKYVVISSGEIDCMSAYQMLEEYRLSDDKRRGYDPIPVVSGAAGEVGSIKQIQAAYEWLDRFDKIVYIKDMDEAGDEAVELLVDVLPKNKLLIVTLPEKDANVMLEKGKQKQFVSAFFNAKPHVPVGVKTAADAFEDIPEELKMTRITLPSYMKVIQEMMGGGMRQGRMCNIIADTSVGKTTHVRRMVYHWIFNSPVIPTIVSLEDTSGQYMLDLIGIHLEENMSWNKTEPEILEWLQTEEGQRVKQELCFKEDGSPRFYIIDERGGTIKHIEDQMSVMYKKHDSRLFVVDVLTDLLRGSNADLAEDHMNFQKAFLKEGATIINVHHTRKPLPDKEGKMRKVSEYDVLGTGSFVQSAAYNIVLNRDKLSPDPLTRNVTEVDLPKCRGGKTGSGGSWYYDFNTVKCYDLDDWLTMNN